MSSAQKAFRQGSFRRLRYNKAVADKGFIGEKVIDLDQAIANFRDPRQEWRRLISEFIGTFFLVLVAAGGAMVSKAYPGTVSPAAAVVAPGLMVMAIIMFMGKVSGAHLNPGVSIAFALRKDFPWSRVPGYIVVQIAGAIAAALLLEALVGVSASDGGNYPGAGTSDLAAFGTEAVLTFGLVSVILGTASGAQNIGIVGAVGVGAYIALAGLWAAPLSGASMNFARTFGPDLIGGDLTAIWIYLTGPLLGAVAAVAFAFVLRGPGGGFTGSSAAQGTIDTEVADPDQPAPGKPAKKAKSKTAGSKKKKSVKQQKG